MFPNLRDILIYDSNVSDFEGCPHGHRFRPDRHRADPREGGLCDVDEDRTDRRIVSAVREYDLIAKVEADSYEAIGAVVMSKIRSIEGVKATKTLARVAF